MFASAATVMSRIDTASIPRVANSSSAVTSSRSRVLLRICVRGQPRQERDAVGDVVERRGNLRTGVQLMEIAGERADDQHVVLFVEPYRDDCIRRGELGRERVMVHDPRRDGRSTA